jgi:hypothetical protein
MTRVSKAVFSLHQLYTSKSLFMNTKYSLVRYSLGTLLAIVALNAFGGGYYGMSGAENVPVEWLENSPFPNYFIPSLFLFVAVGGSCLGAAIMAFRGRESARRYAVISALIIFGWLTAQIAIIGYVSWMQPATSIAALLILILGLLYHSKPQLAKEV